MLGMTSVGELAKLLPARLLARRPPMLRAIRRGSLFLVRSALPFPRLPQIYDVHHLYCGPIIFSARTSASNSSAVTKPSAIASFFKVVPFWCAVFATFAALS